MNKRKVAIDGHHRSCMSETSTELCLAHVSLQKPDRKKLEQAEVVSSQNRSEYTYFAHDCVKT